MKLPDNFGQLWQERNNKEALASEEFRRRCPPAYFELLKSLQTKTEFQCPADAVHGFHFSPKQLTEVTPRGGELYLFVRKPTEHEMQEVAKLVTTASGWAGRPAGDEYLKYASPVPTMVYCYEIHPDDSIRDQTVTVKRNADYTATRLMGIGVEADDSLKWNVSNTESVVVAL